MAASSRLGVEILAREGVPQPFRLVAGWPDTSNWRALTAKRFDLLRAWSRADGKDQHHHPTDYPAQFW